MSESSKPCPLGDGRLLLAVLLLLGAPACDNVGRVFDRGGGGGGGTPSSSQIQAPPTGGLVLDARPSVVEVFPSGGGFAVTTPVVLLFNEAMNFDSLTDSTTTPPSHVFVRLKDEPEETVPGIYDLLLGGRLLIFRPTTPLVPRATYEIVAGSSVRDVDRAALGKTGVLSEFTVDAPQESGPAVLASFPRDNDRSILRETGVFTIFTVAVTQSTVTETSLFLRKKGQSSNLSAAISYPVRIATAADTRVVLLSPSAPLESSSTYELTYTEDIKTGEVALDVGTKTPPVTFTTMEPLGLVGLETEPTVVGTQTIQNSFNIGTVANPKLRVDVPDGTKVGDKLTVRIYGDDPSKPNESLLKFVETSASIASAGAHTETVSLGGLLGAVGSTALKDGSITIVGRLSRGSQITGYVRAPAALLDTVRPTLTQIGPPKANSGTNVYLTDLNGAVLYGKASERLGALELTILGSSKGLFASSADGRFMSLGFFLDRRTADVPFSLNLIDAAGNLAGAAVSGAMRQRGFVTGLIATGNSLQVVVYDDATLQALEGATVVIEPGMPKKPPVGRLTKTTDANGSASFSGLTATSYSITVVHAGYQLASLLDTPAGFVSLPVRPIQDATARVSGTLDFAALPNIRARVGINLLEDASQDHFLETTGTAPRTVPGTAVRPNRPLLVSAFAGAMPPTAKPSFVLFSNQIGSSSGGSGSNQPPPEALVAKGQYVLDLPLVSGLTNTGGLLLPVGLSLATAAGLDTQNLVGGKPVVNMLMSLGGFAGMSLAGTGFASGSGTSWTVDGSFSLATIADLAALGPILWISSQATDSAGNSTRNRALITDPLNPIALSLAAVAAIPTISTPATTFSGSPEVTFEDRLDSSLVANTLALRKIRATDPSGRSWVLLQTDSDAASKTQKVQFPDLAGLTGLATGAWSIFIEDHLILAPAISESEFNFEDVARYELTFARSKSVTHTVQ